MSGTMRQIFLLCLAVSCELNPLFAKLDPETVDVDVHSPPLLSSLFSRNRAMLASNLRLSAPVGTALQIVAQNWAPWRAPGSTRVGTVAGIEVEEADD